MNNLSLILNTYFVEADFDKIVGSPRNPSKRTAEIGMDEDDFVNHFLDQEKAYGFDVVRKLHQHATDCWIADEQRLDSEKNNVFNICAKAAEDMLFYKNDEPVCYRKHFLRWNEISRIVGEDLLILAHLAKNLYHVPVHSFAWKPFIKSDSITINDILEKGLHELHSHMNGASLNFDINWLALMNGAKIQPYYIKILKKKFPTELRNAQKAIAIRWYLYAKIKGLNFADKKRLEKVLRSSSDLELQTYLEDFFPEISIQKQKAFKFGGHAIDYAIPESITKKDKSRYYNVPLIGEREFLYEVLQKIYFPSDGDDDYGYLLYAYIVAKNNFRKVIVQYDQIKGFGYFDEIQNRKMLFDGSIYERLSAYMAVHNVVCNQPIKSMEMRIAPKDKSEKLLNSVKKSNKSINNADFRFGEDSQISKDAKFGYILHFIKQKDRKWNDTFEGDLYCRNYKVRKIVNRQASAISALLRKNNSHVVGGYKYNPTVNFMGTGNSPDIDCRIVGIDAANSEFYCRPEVFAPTFRRLKYVRRNTDIDSIVEHTDAQLGRTYHVGEDYYDIVDGLRAIDECITFMEFGEGDRIGHGVALGIDAKKYYFDRQNRVVMPKQDLLDNAVWLYMKMDEYSIADQDGLKGRLQRLFYKLYREIYADLIKREPEVFQSVSIEEYYDSWKLRGDKPKFEPKDKFFRPYGERKGEELDAIRDVPKLKKLFMAYHYSGKAKKNGSVSVEYHLGECDYRIICDLQREMRKEIEKRRISIETNPTSNLQITDVGMYCEHPVTTMNNTYLRSKPDSMIDVSINTDDQGVFATSLEKEFTLMALALEKQVDVDGNPVYQKNDIYQWLDMVRASAGPRSFLAKG
ncbi:hypothetical protein [Fibrobacter succinogenes]|uniref:hypothetical protein n=1 Tax=Fibrobacter succinogenes TaxID=833 RepID=UPI0015671858|nr:hypothetical protein [Fibrobacter succinogenes]